MQVGRPAVSVAMQVGGRHGPRLHDVGRHVDHYRRRRVFELITADQRAQFLQRFVIVDLEPADMRGWGHFNQNRGLALSLTNFDLELANGFLPNNRFQLRGKMYDFDVRLRDVYRLSGMESYVTTDTIFVNRQPYGRLTGNFEMLNLASPLWFRVFALDGNRLRGKVWQQVIERFGEDVVG